jgi:DNA-binding IclR family transcriptional regulator
MTRTKINITDSPYRVQVLDRALGILDLLWKEGPELTLVELTERLGLNKSTVRRLIKVLEQYRFIEQSPRNGKYRLGLKLFEMGSSVMAHLDLRERARPYLERLVFEAGETAHLCILDEGEVVYLEKVETQRTVRIPSSVGRRNPAHCTAVGKAILAFLPENELGDVIQKRGLRAYTRNTITTLAQLKRDLQLVRQRGYSLDNEEIEEGLKCIGAPVRDYSGKVIASVSIAGPAFRLTKDKIAALAQAVVETAHALSTELGHQEKRLAAATANQAAR